MIRPDRLDNPVQLSERRRGGRRSSMSVARRVGRATATTLIAGTVGGAAVLAAEAAIARGRRYAKPDPNLAIRTSHGDPKLPQVRLVLLGDSSALGVGVGRVV